MGDHESELISDSLSGNRKSWVTAKEVAGLVGMPTTDRRTRDILDEWAKGKEQARRKRSGTKAFEYHISVLPKSVREQLVIETNQNKMIAAESGSAYSLDSSSSAAIVAASFPGKANKFLKSKSDGYTSNETSEVVNICIFIEEPELSLHEMGPSFPVSSKWLEWRGLDPRNLAFYVQNGDSMSERINSRDTVIIDSGDTNLTDGALMVIEVDGVALIRNVQKVLGGWRLNCENPRYEPITLSVDSDFSCKVIGRVVRIINEV